MKGLVYSAMWRDIYSGKVMKRERGTDVRYKVDSSPFSNAQAFVLGHFRVQTTHYILLPSFSIPLEYLKLHSHPSFQLSNICPL